MTTRSGVHYHQSQAQPNLTMDHDFGAQLKAITDWLAQISDQMDHKFDQMTHRFDRVEDRLGTLERSKESNTEPELESPLPTPPNPRRV